MAKLKPKPAAIETTLPLAVPYEYESPSWAGSYEGCRPGTNELIAWLGERRGIERVSCYADRQVPNSGGSPSTHREGRTIDVGLASNGYSAEQMQQLVDDLVAAAPSIQVQQIIYAMRFWRVGVGWSDYDGAAGQHYDHAHIELTHRAADELTRAMLDEATGYEPPPAPDPDEMENLTMQPPILYRDESLANVFAIFPTGAVLHLSSELVEHYKANGAGEPIVGTHNPQTIAGLFGSAHLDQNANAVAFG